MKYSVQVNGTVLFTYKSMKKANEVWAIVTRVCPDAEVSIIVEREVFNK